MVDLPNVEISNPFEEVGKGVSSASDALVAPVKAAGEEARKVMEKVRDTAIILALVAAGLFILYMVIKYKLYSNQNYMNLKIAQTQAAGQIGAAAAGTGRQVAPMAAGLPPGSV